MNDKQTTLSELKDLVKHFVDERDWDQFHTPKDLAIGLITEASEFLEHFRFKSDCEAKELFCCPSKKEELADELADVTFFILRISEKFGIDMATAIKNKLQKSARNYPIEKAKGSNKKYTEFV